MMRFDVDALQRGAGVVNLREGEDHSYAFGTSRR